MGKTVRLTPKIKPKFKYNINQQLGLLPRDLGIMKVIDHLENNGISKAEFYRDRAILLDSFQSISADRLLIYTQVFDCTIEELVNNPVRAKSIRTRDKTSSKSGLK